jgi:hypothetical protein
MEEGRGRKRISGDLNHNTNNIISDKCWRRFLRWANTLVLYCCCGFLDWDFTDWSWLNNVHLIVN